jgi:tetratricopeptide (TPR) repeat protein
VAIDRDTTIRRAEKLARDGRLEAAIAQYQALVDDQPGDWNAANLLGDLLVRAGQVDKAIMQFARIADHLAREGFLPKAAALYKKILKIDPDDDEAAIRAADVSMQQGLVAAARGYLTGAIDRRHARGDRRGAAELMVRLGALDPGDTTGRVAAARALAQAGDGPGAARELRAVAGELTDAGREAEGLDVLREAAGYDPQNDEIRGHLVRAALRRRDLQSVFAHARSTIHLKEAAAAIQAMGDFASSVAVLERVIAIDPDDGEAAVFLARACARLGNAARARDHLSHARATTVEAQLAFAEVELATGRFDQGRAALRSVLERIPDARSRIIDMALDLGRSMPEAAFCSVDVVVSADARAGAWRRAADTLTQVIDRNPGHLPSLVRLVEICVDGELGGGALQRARERLADAYLDAGRGLEARLIAEDLVGSAPWEPAQVHRLRRALSLLGDPDPDRAIVDRLAESTRPRSGRAVEQPIGAGAGAPGLDDAIERAFELDARDLDVRSALREVGANGVGSQVELVEVDLSRAIDQIDRTAKGAAMSSEGPRDLEGVFEDFRQEVSRESALEEAEQHYALALTYRDMGLVEEAIVALERAARSPKRRFAAAALLGRLYLGRNNLAGAIEWFERAAEAPAPTAEEGRALLYELAATLERAGEGARALAVFLELRADADEYRDVATRIGRLMDRQAKG